jgi:hypothetical protein
MAKHKYIEKPEMLLDMFNDYKEQTKANPRYKHQLCQRTAEMIKEPLEVPLTMEGFEIFCFEKYNLTIENYFKNANGSYDDYYPICTYIKKMIRNDQIQGGLVGQYNPSITQRLNGLVEKSQVEQDGKIEVVFVKGKTIL